MLNPQAFSSTVWNVLSILQEQFGSMAGANMLVFGAKIGHIGEYSICFGLDLCMRFLQPDT